MKRRTPCVIVFCLACLLVLLALPFYAEAGTKLARPKLTEVKQDSYFVDTMYVAWDKVQDATKYEIYVSKDGGKYKLIKTLKNKEFYYHENLTRGSKYSYKVKAVNGQSKSKFSKVKSASILTTKQWYEKLKKRMGSYIYAIYQDDSNVTYSPSVEYNRNEHKFVFSDSVYLNNGKSYIVTMKVDYKSIANGTVYVTVSSSGGFFNYFASAKMKMSDYYSSVPFTAAVSFNSAEAEYAFGNAFDRWKDLILDKTKLKMWQLGFLKK